MQSLTETGPSTANSQKRHRKSVPKVKTGCRTCKLRRLKCDEGRPACTRCVSSGRACDGYGIWGGGSSIAATNPGCIVYGSKYSIGTISRLQTKLPLSVGEAAVHEQRFLDWFKSRTVVRSSGLFRRDFWDILVLQMSHREPSVLHAVVALSILHQNWALVRDKKSSREHAQLALEHYGKSIRHLQQLMGNNEDKMMVRVALTTCIIFTCFEFLRGHYTSALQHVGKGSRLLAEANSECLGVTNIFIATKPPRDSTDDCLADMFSRFNVQLALYNTQSAQWQPTPRATIRATNSMRTIDHARSMLDGMLNEAASLENSYGSATTGQICSEDLQRQKQLQADLAKWLHIFESTKPQFEAQIGVAPRSAMLFIMLRFRYHLATIMADTCLRQGDESVFDLHVSQFLEVISLAIDLQRLMRDPAAVKARCTRDPDAPCFAADIGWIPTLYLTAMKCRVHRIRVHAMRLLERTPSREGIWDARQQAAIARRVMALEEAACYGNTQFDETWSLEDYPSDSEILISLPLASNRIQQCTIVPHEAPERRSFIICKRTLADGTCEVLGHEYDAAGGWWKIKPLR